MLSLLQKAVQRKQIFQNSPWIDQAELDKSILELDDPTNSFVLGGGIADAINPINN